MLRIHCREVDSSCLRDTEYKSREFLCNSKQSTDDESGFVQYTVYWRFEFLSTGYRVQEQRVLVYTTVEFLFAGYSVEESTKE